MNTTWIIVKKELKSYFNSPIAYILITVFSVMSSWLYFKALFLSKAANLREFLGILPWLFLYIIPAITMRLWAEEKKLKTIELLLTWPVRDIEAVMGKFLAAAIFLGIMLGLTFPLPLTLLYLGSPDIGLIITGYLGAFLLGCSFLAIGNFLSSLTENQIVAFIMGVTICFMFILIGQPVVLLNTPAFLAPIFEYLSLQQHFLSIQRGVIDSRDIVFYISLIGFFLYLNVWSIQNRDGN